MTRDIESSTLFETDVFIFQKIYRIVDQKQNGGFNYYAIFYQTILETQKLNSKIFISYTM